MGPRSLESESSVSIASESAKQPLPTSKVPNKKIDDNKQIKEMQALSLPLSKVAAKNAQKLLEQKKAAS